jgi:hypothetical protein
VDLLLVAVFVLFIKLPVIACCFYIYKAIHDVPMPDLGEDGGEFIRANFTPGPRKRGPHGGPDTAKRLLRRGNKGHDEAATPARRGPVVNA